MKKHILVLVAAMTMAVLGLVSCGGGGGGGGAASGGVVSGSAAKGPFQLGSAVTAYKLSTSGVRPTTATANNTVTTTVTDNLGTYAFANIPWTGMTEVEIVGSYLDENTGLVTTANGTVSAIINLTAVAAGTVSSTTTNPNIASTIAASVAKTTLAASPATNTTAIASVLQSASQVTATALGLPTSIAGVAIDLSKLNVLDTRNASLGAANQALLAVSAGILDANTNLGTNLNTFATFLATDISTGKVLGATSGGTATAVLATSQATANTTAANIAAIITTAITSANAVAGATQTPVDTGLAASLATAATTVVNTSSTVLRGLAMSGNSFTVGAATYTVNNAGVATTVGSTSVNNVVLGFTLVDRGNAAGTGALAKTYSTSFNFKIKSTGDTRLIEGSISPVTVVTDGLGAVTVTVPTNAVLHFSGIDSGNVAVASATAGVTNLAANIIQTNASVVSIDANTLLNTIQSKVGNAQLNILQTAGVFSFDFSLGLNIGFLNPAGNALANLYPVTATGGRGITGTLTTF